MYRKSKFRLAKRVGGNALIALIALGSGVAVANVVSHQSHTATTALANPVATSLRASSASSTTSQPVSSTRVSLVSSTTPHVTAVSGIVTALSNSSVSIRSRTGATLTYALNSSTVVMQGRTKTTLASVRVGTQVFLVPAASSPTTAAAIGIVPVTAGGESSEGGSSQSDGN